MWLSLTKTDHEFVQTLIEVVPQYHSVWILCWSLGLRVTRSTVKFLNWREAIVHMAVVIGQHPWVSAFWNEIPRSGLLHGIPCDSATRKSSGVNVSWQSTVMLDMASQAELSLEFPHFPGYCFSSERVTLSRQSKPWLVLQKTIVWQRPPKFIQALQEYLWN